MLHHRARVWFISAVLTLTLISFMLVYTVPSSAGVISLPRTGQTKCYDAGGTQIDCAGTGQDGEIQAGVPWPNPRFTSGTGAEAGCMIDNLTGLMWPKNGNLPGIYKTWNNAIDYSNNLTLCGYSDWRLPNINELNSLVNSAMSDPSVWLNEQGFSGVQSGHYWSSSTNVQTTGEAWRVGLFFGYENNGDKTNGGYVWPTRDWRGGTAAIVLSATGQTVSYRTGDDGDLESGVGWEPGMRFTTEEECVVDHLTGLMWSKNANLPNEPRTWQEALNYAGNLTLCGYSDWRIPNRVELTSLVDFSRNNPPLPSGHPFINVQSVQTSFYWSSSTDAHNTNCAWVLAMPQGYDTTFGKGTRFHLWPVRGGLAAPPVTSLSLAVSRSGNGTGTITSTPPGIACGSVCSNSFPLGGTVVLTAEADTGSTFTSWSGCDSVNGNECTVGITAEKTVVAAFASVSLPDYRLTITKAGTGRGTLIITDNVLSPLICGEDCTGFVLATGTVVIDPTIPIIITPAAPAPGTGSTFTSWSGCDSVNGNQCVVTLTADKSVIATFTAEPIACTVAVGDLVVKGDACTHPSSGTYILSGRTIIANKDAPDSSLLQIDNGSVTVDQTLSKISCAFPNCSGLYASSIPGLSSKEYLASSFSFEVEGNKLLRPANTLTIPSASNLATGFLFGFEAGIDSIAVNTDSLLITLYLNLPGDIRTTLVPAARDRIIGITGTVLFSPITGVHADGFCFNAEKIKVAGTPLELKDIIFDASVSSHSLTMGAGFQFTEALPSISGGITLVNGGLDAIWGKMGNVDIPIGTSPFDLDEASLKVSGLRTADLTLEGMVSLYGGPPRVLEPFKIVCIKDAAVTIDISSYMKISGYAGVFCCDDIDYAEHGVINAYVEGGFDWKKSILTASGKFTFPFNLYSGRGELTVTPFDLTGSLSSKVCFPDGVPWIGGRCPESSMVLLNQRGFGAEVKVGWIDIAYFVDWGVARVDPKNPLAIFNVLSHIHTGGNLDELSARSYQSLRGPLAVRPQEAEPETVIIPAGLDRALIRLTWETGDTDFSLMAPDGAAITPAYAQVQPESVVYVKQSKEAWYGIKNPLGGAWQLSISNAGSIGAHQVTVSTTNVPPTIEITAPSAKVTSQTTVDIAYTAVDPDDAVAVSLYYDTDNQGANGFLIVDNLAGNGGSGVYTWDVAGVPAGTYFIYAIADDGKNAPVIRYSSGVVEVTHAIPLAPPSNLSATAAGNQVTVSWDIVANAAGYFVYYTNEPLAYSYRDRIAVDGTRGTCVLKDLLPDSTYRIAVSSFGADAESLMAGPVSIATGSVSLPVFSVSPADISLGNRPYGERVSRSLTITNTCSADLLLTSANIYGIGSRNLTIEGVTLPATIAPQGSLPVTVVFDGLREGVIASALTVETNDPSHINNVITLTGSVGNPFQLRQGWNFISVPKRLANPALAHFLGKIFANVAIVWGYDAVNQQWLKYRPDTDSGTLSAIEWGKGYWVYMTLPDIPVVDGDTPSASVQLSEGWNLVGYNGTDGADVASALQGIAGKWSIIWNWDNGQWYGKHEVITTLPAPIQPLTNLFQGKAYWIKIKQGMGPVEWAQ